MWSNIVEGMTLMRLLSLLISDPLILILIVKSKNNKQAVGDVSTDSDWWGNSATPCSLAAGHGLISLDESHWHSSYLNDSVYLSIPPPFLSPLPQPLALLLHPPTIQRSRWSSRTHPRRMTPLWACAPLLWTVVGFYCRGSPCKLQRSTISAQMKIFFFFYWWQTRGSGEWLTKAVSRCRRSKHHTNRNTPVTPRNMSLWNRLHEMSLWDIHLNGKKK